MADRAASTVAARRAAATHGRTRAGHPPAAAPEPDAAAPATAGRVPAVRPGEEPWTEEEILGIRSELTSDVDRLGHELEAMQARLDEMMRDGGDGAGDDQADTGAKAYEREQGLTFLTGTRATIFQLEQAVARLDDGSFADCDSCGEAIGKARLQAFPRATVCVSCKQRQERR
ncbi:MAG: TraR/DksA C4-type zinc finger protein [Kineosporiaceae bacterium]